MISVMGVIGAISIIFCLWIFRCWCYNTYNTHNTYKKLFNPASQAFPPSHLDKVCKHPLPSVWRRFIL